MRFFRLLKGELGLEAKEWVAKSIITREQADLILSLYGAKYPDAKSSGNFGYLVLMTVASLLVGLAVLVIIGANWENIPRHIRMGMVVGVTVVVNVAACVQYKKGNRIAAEAVFFLGSLCYGTAIMLIAQIYHLGEHYPDGILFWILGILPLALILESTALIILCQILAFIWMQLEFSMGYLPLWYVPMFGSFMWFCFKMKHSLKVYLLTLISGFIFLEFFLSHMLQTGKHYQTFDIANGYFTVAMTFVLFTWAKYFEHTSRLPPKFIDYTLITRIWAFRLALFFLFLFSFKSPWKEVLRESYAYPAFVLSIGTVVLLSLVWVCIKRFRDFDGSLKSFIMVHYLEIVAGIFLGLFCFMVNTFHLNALILQIVTNLILFLTGVRLMVRGIKNYLSSELYTGLGIVLILSFLRYVSLIGDYLGAAAIFLIGGVVMLIVATYWKKYLHQRQEAES